jgi:hypothetical protein
LIAVAWDGRSEADSAKDSPAVRYARAHVALAEANLKKVEVTNQRVANAVPRNVVAEYREDLELARMRLEQSLRNPGAAPMPIWLRTAEAVSKNAETEWKSAVAANQRMAGAVDELEVERLRIQSQLAKVRLEFGRSLSGRPVDEQRQWQMAFLMDELELVKEQIRRSPPSVRIYPFWWY